MSSASDCFLEGVELRRSLPPGYKRDAPVRAQGGVSRGSRPAEWCPSVAARLVPLGDWLASVRQNGAPGVKTLGFVGVWVGVGQF